MGTAWIEPVEIPGFFPSTSLGFGGDRKWLVVPVAQQDPGASVVFGPLPASVHADEIVAALTCEVASDSSGNWTLSFS